MHSLLDGGPNVKHPVAFNVNYCFYYYYLFISILCDRKFPRVFFVFLLFNDADGNGILNMLFNPFAVTFVCGVKLHTYFI